MMKSLVIAALMAAPLLLSCSKPESGKEEPAEAGEVVLSMADPSATAETKALYTNLWAIRDKGWMFGHHDDLMYGRKWYGEPNQLPHQGAVQHVYLIAFIHFGRKITKYMGNGRLGVEIKA